LKTVSTIRVIPLSYSWSDIFLWEYVLVKIAQAKRLSVFPPFRFLTHRKKKERRRSKTRYSKDDDDKTHTERDGGEISSLP